MTRQPRLAENHQKPSSWVRISAPWYQLDFFADAKKEWDKLGHPVREQFRKKLIERLGNPHVPSAKPAGMDNCYKIKLRKAGYRLIYQVEDDVLIVAVVAVGKRERGDVYRVAARRLY